MKSTRFRDEFPILGRVEDLEQSRQWAGLTCDIRNLERLSSIDRRRWRKSASNPLENAPRGMRAMQRRSMPEVTKPDLVYVRMTNSENVRSTGMEKIEDREDRTRWGRERCTFADSEIVQACNWRPRTEFERNYFGTTENVRTIGDEVNRRCSSMGNEVNRKTNENETSPISDSFTNESYNGDRNEYPRKSNRTNQPFNRSDETIWTCQIDDSNERAIPRTSDSSFRSVNPRIPDIRQAKKETSERMNDRSSSLAENHSQFSSAKQDPGDPIAKDRSDKIEIPAHRYVRENENAEYRGSRERLHEIFEHNRLLRRQFFAGMPSHDVNNDNHLNDPNNNEKSRRDTGTNEEKSRRDQSDESSAMTIKDRHELPKNSGTTGFGSTETLTSQSNQSGASSSNGRKSRIEFGNTPEPTEDPKIYEKTVTITNDFTRTKRDNDDHYSSEVRTASFSRDFLPLPSTSSIEYRSNSLDDINEVDLYDEDLNSRGMRKEVPIDATTIDLTLKNSTPILQHHRTTDFLDTDKKCFPTYMNIEDLSKYRSRVCSSQMIDGIAARGRKKLPDPLDLTTINQRWDDRWNTERDILKDYSIEVTPLRDYERSSRGVLTVLGKADHRWNEKLNVSPNELNDTSILLRGSKSLLELSTNLSRSPSSSLTRKIPNDSSIRRKNLASCLSSSNVDELRSPQLVNNFSNSLNDLADRVDNNGREQRSPRHFQDLDNEEDTEGSRSHMSQDSLRRRSEISATTTGNGTTLPLVYGPIPYKSPRRYVEGEVTIHYRSPVRHEAKEILSEEELARRSAENMRRVYQEERRRKYLQELHDIDSRRHTDNFVPSQKSPIPLNRYDDFVDDLSYRSRSQEQTPEPRLVARALYNFVGQSSRELTFRRGDLIFVRRQVDKNWYEGEHNAMIGLFPFNYVEILPYDGTRTTIKKPYEGQARAKFNFVAQTNLELSLAKGELVIITRRVDENWYEGRIGNRKGIFPVSYVEVIAEPGHRSETPVQSSKPVASPAAHSLLSNGTAGGKMSMGPHHYTPSMPVNPSTTQPHYNSLPRMGGNKLHVAPVNETLHIDTHSETIPYRALYNYRPQNEDELELKEGDTVYVMEKCDDGWYVGSSQRTGYFGTFPGNYVERL